MVDWAYVNGFGDEGGDPDHDIRDPEGHSGYVVKDAHGPRIACQFCGSTDVFWSKWLGAWRLKNRSDFELHQCRDAVNRNSDGFDEVA